MPDASERLPVRKTCKLFIGGRFPRSESGRLLTATSVTTGKPIANVSAASRKDLRDAVSAARAAFAGWQAASPYLRGQILYRMAEILECRREELAREIATSLGSARAKAGREVDAAVDRLVHLAGWTDKIPQLFGSVNAVSTPHFNFSVPEPTGVVGIICPDMPPLLALATLVGRVVLTGNSTVVVASESAPLPAVAFSEIVATSDVPPGVVNLLTGRRADLAPTLATHMDVDAVVDASNCAETSSVLRRGTASNLKRVTQDPCARPADWFDDAKAADPYTILDTVEIKTTWHPVRA